MKDSRSTRSRRTKSPTPNCLPSSNTAAILVKALSTTEIRNFNSRRYIECTWKCPGRTQRCNNARLLCHWSTLRRPMHSLSLSHYSCNAYYYYTSLKITTVSPVCIIFVYFRIYIYIICRALLNQETPK